MTLMLLQQLSGINVILFYAQTIFTLSGIDLDPGLFFSFYTKWLFLNKFSISALCSTFLALTQLIGCVVVVFSVEAVGRKLTLILSELLSCLSLFGASLFFYLKTTNFDLSSFGWIPLSCLILFIFSFSSGLGAIPWTLNAELHPPESKAKASCIAYSACWFFAFVITQIGPIVQQFIGIHGLFAIFASSGLMGSSNLTISLCCACH